MTQEEANVLKHGVYRIYWTPENTSPAWSYSLAAVGSDSSGLRWFIPVNWVSLQASKKWELLERVEPVEEMNYDQKPERVDLTPTGSYKIQIQDDRLYISKSISITLKGYRLELSLSKLIQALRECGYKIDEPPSRRFLEIKSFLDSPDQRLTCMDALGNKVYSYERYSLKDSPARYVTIAETDSFVNVDVKGENGNVFVGHVLSLEEFKLIWDRIL